MKLLAHLAVVVLCAGLLACGTPGAPRPPSLELARPVDDLTATRKGDTVTLTWTPSDENTDGTLVKRTGPTRICRGMNDFPMTSCGQPVADVSVPAPPPAAKGQEQRVAFTDTLPPPLEQQFPAGFATYAVEMFNHRGRSAGLSNQVRVPLAPTLPPPGQITCQVTPEGVEISATAAEPAPAPAGLTFEFHLYRRTEGGAGEVDLGTPMAVAHAGGGLLLTFLDRSVEWEKTYFYHVSAVTTVTQGGKLVAQVEGADSPAVKVSVHDIFPPARPVGLQAVFSGVGQKPFIDLTWASNQEPDLAGYNVYRREAGGEWVKINRELVKAPAFRDSDVEPGRTYYYSVSAVDLRGNESRRSEETSEKVPAVGP